MRTIRRTAYVECPFSAVVDLAQHSVERLKVVRISLGSNSAPLRRVRVAARTPRDFGDPARRHEALEVDLVPVGERTFPTFAVTVTVRPAQTGSRLHVVATYRPPLGRLGEVGDAVAGHHVADRIVDAFVANLIEAIERRWLEQSRNWLSIHVAAR